MGKQVLECCAAAKGSRQRELAHPGIPDLLVP